MGPPRPVESAARPTCHPAPPFPRVNTSPRPTQCERGWREGWSGSPARPLFAIRTPRLTSSSAKPRRGGERDRPAPPRGARVSGPRRAGTPRSPGIRPAHEPSWGRASFGAPTTPALLQPPQQGGPAAPAPSQAAAFHLARWHRPDTGSRVSTGFPKAACRLPNTPPPAGPRGEGEADGDARAGGRAPSRAPPPPGTSSAPRRLVSKEPGARQREGRGGAARGVRMRSDGRGGAARCSRGVPYRACALLWGGVRR